MKIDLVNHHPETDEFAIHLIEQGPWLTEDRIERLRSLQERLYDAIDVAIDGHLCKLYADSHGKHVRIHVGVHNFPTDDVRAVQALITRLQEHMRSDVELARDIASSPFVAGLSMLFEDLSSEPGGER